MKTGRCRVRTPALARAGAKENYLTEHLSKDLDWLLRAATEWRVQVELNLGISGYQVQNYAVDSACLHARTLFEFFCLPNRSEGDNHYGCNQYIGRVLESRLYTENWSDPLHAYLMHAQDRSTPRRLISFGDPTIERDNLNKMPVDFALEILRLWQKFEHELGNSSDPEIKKLQAIARDKRKEAIDHARPVTQFIDERHSAYKRERVKAQSLKPIFVFSS